MLRALVLVIALCTASAAYAGELRITITNENGRPVADAVATIEGVAQTTGVIHFSWPMRIAQHNMQFDPFVLVASVGSVVAFPNLDDVRHQVYSFSPAGPFELRLYGHEESRTIQFHNVGIIAIGCNIHDQMSAFIDVVDTPYAMKTHANGLAVIGNVPPGPAVLRIWHPYLRGTNNIVERQIVIPAGVMNQAFQVRLRAPPDHTMSY